MPKVSSRLASEAAIVARFPQERLGDAQLLDGVVRGERAALAAIWDRYCPMVRSVVHRTLGPDSATDDIVQEVFVALWRGAKNIRRSEALKGYLMGVAVRLVVLDLRRRKVRSWVRLSPTGVLPEVAVGPRDIEGREALRALYRVFDKLSSRRRLAFVLRHVQGLEVLETAEALGVSESTAKRELSRAREQVLTWARREPALAAYLRGLEGGVP